MNPSGRSVSEASYTSVRIGDQYSGSQPSAIRVVCAMFLGPSAPSSTGSPDRSGWVIGFSGLPSPVASGPLYGWEWNRPSSSTGPRGAALGG